MVSERIGELREQKEALEDAPAGIGGEQEEAEDEELISQLDRIPDLTEALRTATPQIKRQVFESFDLQIVYDKREGRVEITAPSQRSSQKPSRTRKPSWRRVRAW